MKNIEIRLTKIEKAAAKTDIVTVEFKDTTKKSAEMDLLEAVRLFLKGTVRCIRAKWKSGEEQEYMTSVQREIEDYVNELSEKKRMQIKIAEL